MIKVAFVTLGCPKNRVDSEYMLGMLDGERDMEETTDFDKADVIVVNTCGFIEDAKQESIETILEAARYKEEERCRALVVTGCLTQRYQQELLEEMPEIDAIMGTGSLSEIADTIRQALSGNRLNRTGNPTFDYKGSLPRRLTTESFAYVKIAEGCNNNCTYCSIPSIRGPLNSRELSDIYQEVRQLIDRGYREIILVAQDTTRYGLDLYGQPSLVRLLKKLLTIDKYFWVRIMYSYPEHVSEGLIELMSAEDRICSYLDLPIQHSEDRIRRLMNREGSRQELLEKISKIRDYIPDISLRTSLIVGFPGEKKAEFKRMVNFVKQVRFDRLGVFQYSREENTEAAAMTPQIDEEIKQQRYQEIMKLQQQLSLEKNRSFIGHRLEVIIDELNGDYALGRSRYDAPEIDNTIYIEDPTDLAIGDLITCKIKEGYEYDLIGERVDESTK